MVLHARYLSKHLYYKTAVIEQVAALNPNAWWWIKGDGTDVVKGLWESVRGEWAGDVDLNDGKLQHQQQIFQEQVFWAEGIGLGNRGNLEQIKLDLNSALKNTVDDLDFIYSGN